MKLPPAIFGVLLFAATLTALVWMRGGAASLLPVQMLVAAGAGCAVFRLVPWSKLLTMCTPGGRWYRRALFFVFLGHFVGVLWEEARRVYVARKLAAPQRWGGWYFRSLAQATAALMVRTCVRAERFYASLVVRGMSW